MVLPCPPVATIAQINISDGGVPKRPVPIAQVTTLGVVGDRQQNLKYHGGPNRALCLWSLEVIETLQQEGHPMAPGCAGENLTLAGVDWASLTPGCRLTLGDTVQIEITDYAAPCRKNMRWFSDRRFSRMAQKHHPGSSRLYARVLREGSVVPGDSVAVLPPDFTTDPESL